MHAIAVVALPYVSALGAATLGPAYSCSVAEPSPCAMWSAQLAPPSGHPSGILGPKDRRVQIAPDQWPWSSIGRITTTGTITEYRTGLTTNSKPTGITAADDGNIYFTESAGPGRIGIITPTGGISELATPTSNSQPTGITTGADGSAPIVLQLPVTKCVPPVVEQLREVLRTHPGTTEVHMRLRGNQKTTVVRLDDKLRVTPGPALQADLKQLLGPSCIAS